MKEEQNKLSIGILISGWGKSAVDLMEEENLGMFNSSINAVITSGRYEGAMQLASLNDIPTLSVTYKGREKDSVETEIADFLKANACSHVFLCGFMHILSPFFLNHFENRVVNIHPSLLPSFKGINAIQQAINYGVEVSGLTTHYVSEKLDEGVIIYQSAVNVRGKLLPDVINEFSVAGKKLLVRTILNLEKSDLGE